MKKTVIAALAGAAATALVFVAPASAQTASSFTAQLNDTVMNLRGYTQRDVTPTGERVRLRLMEGGAARMTFSAFDGGEGVEQWAFWRVNERNQFCTTAAILGASNELIPVDAEDCLDFRLDGNRIGLNFYSSSGAIDRYSGTFRPM